jgi:hypothetical protein
MGILEALAGMGGAGIKGYQGAQKSNQQFSLRKLAKLLEVMRMQQRDQSFERQGDWRQEDIQHRTGREEIMDRRYETGQRTDAMDAEMDMVQAGRTREDKVTAAAQAHRNAIELQKLRNQGKGGVDPNIAANRRLDQRKKLDSVLRGIVGAQQDREFGEYEAAGGVVGKDLGLRTPNPPMLGTGWGGPAPYPNPAIKEQEEMNFWKMSNPAALDSAATIGNLRELFQKHYGKKQPKKQSLDDEIKQLEKELGL